MYVASRKVIAVAIAAAACAVMACPFPRAIAQSPDMLKKLQEIKATSEANKQALALYTWQEVMTISLKGEVKKTETFQVMIGPDGKQQKTEIGSTQAPAPSGGKLKQRIVAKKKEQFQVYGEQIADLAKQYSQPDPALLQQAYEKGNISAQLGGAAGTVSLVIKNYIKPGDSMTLVFNQNPKGIASIHVATYLDDPSDAVTETVNFAKLPTNGLNHVASVQVNGVSKQLGVDIQNSNYQLRQQ